MLPGIVYAANYPTVREFSSEAELLREFMGRRTVAAPIAMTAKHFHRADRRRQAGFTHFLERLIHVMWGNARRAAGLDC